MKVHMNEDVLVRNRKRAKECGIILPTFKELAYPSEIPVNIQSKLLSIGLNDANPLNLFRITWKNEPKLSGGLYGPPNYIELPKEFTGVDAKIVCLVGKWFPTGCHKVGAAYGCLIPKLVTGTFDSTSQKAVWPSTGNFCRGGAFNSKILSCFSIAILPEDMSAERFQWLKNTANEIITTPGSESNVKEIFDKVWELRNTRDDIVVFNQFEEMGNYLWHYYVTGRAMDEVFQNFDGANLAGLCVSSGSGGTLASGDFLKKKYPFMKLAVCEAYQCSTILNNGYGEHRIEGIGDKHIPWIHNVKNSDMVIDIDDYDALSLFRLINEEAGKQFLREECKLSEETMDNLSLIGISGMANILSAIKFSKYFELTDNDIVFTVLTDTSSMYLSRIQEMKAKTGEYTVRQAEIDYALHLAGLKTDLMKELSYRDRKRIHNLKYYTWVEQQQKPCEELNAQWYSHVWEETQNMAEVFDDLITDFNERVGIKRTI